MHLHTVGIKHFRSIQTLELKNCGALNVLIGKNNSGKSSILASINTFFDFVRGASIVNPDFRAPKAIEFHNNDTTHDVSIDLVFSITLAERDGIIQDIISEYPQMKNAVEGLDPSLPLLVSLTLTTKPRPFGYISKLSLGGSVLTEDFQPDNERVLLRVTADSAAELLSNEMKYRSGVQNAEVVRMLAQRVDEDDWRRVQKENDPGVLFRYYLRPDAERRYSPTPEVLTIIRRISTESSSLADFQRALQAVVSAESANAESLKKTQLRNKIDTYAGDESTVPSYVTNLLGRISRQKVHYLTDRRTPIGREEAERLLTLKKRRRGLEQLNTIQDTVAALLGVKIDAFEPEEPVQPISRERHVERATAELDVDDFLVEVNGSGIREALRLILDVEFGQPDMVLVEEPEMHLHPALEISIMRYLKGISSRCQVFLTTHSTNFLDTADMKNVYLVSKNPATSVQIIDIEDAEATLPRELGLRLSSLFMFDRLVFLESPSDEGVIREWATKLGINFGQLNVGFVAMGGVRFLGFFAAEQTLSFLMKRNVKTWILIDRDEKDAFDVDGLIKEYGTQTSIKVLNKREMENYLLCPRAIIQFIKLKRELANKHSSEALPTEEDIRNAIEEEAEKLKTFTIHKRVQKHLSRPIYPKFTALGDSQTSADVTGVVEAELDRQAGILAEARSKVREIFERENTAVESAWSQSKLDYVPGDILLDMVCQRFGVRFKKERDGVRIASLMLETEIANEIQMMLNEFGR